MKNFFQQSSLISKMRKITLAVGLSLTALNGYSQNYSGKYFNNAQDLIPHGRGVVELNNNIFVFGKSLDANLGIGQLNNGFVMKIDKGIGNLAQAPFYYTGSVEDLTATATVDGNLLVAVLVRGSSTLAHVDFIKMDDNFNVIWHNRRDLPLDPADPNAANKEYRVAVVGNKNPINESFFIAHPFKGTAALNTVSYAITAIDNSGNLLWANQYDDMPTSGQQYSVNVPNDIEIEPSTGRLMVTGIQSKRTSTALEYRAFYHILTPTGGNLSDQRMLETGAALNRIANAYRHPGNQALNCQVIYDQLNQNFVIAYTDFLSYIQNGIKATTSIIEFSGINPVIAQTRYFWDGGYDIETGFAWSDYHGAYIMHGARSSINLGSASGDELLSIIYPSSSPQASVPQAQVTLSNLAYDHFTNPYTDASGFTYSGVPTRYVSTVTPPTSNGHTDNFRMTVSNPYLDNPCLVNHGTVSWSYQSLSVPPFGKNVISIPNMYAYSQNISSAPFVEDLCPPSSYRPLAVNNTSASGTISFPMGSKVFPVVTNNKNQQFMLYDMNGKKIASGSTADLSQNPQLQGSFASGIYLLTLMTEEGKTTSQKISYRAN